MTFGVTYKVKNAFFDRKAVAAEIGAKSAKALSKFGGYVRKTAQRSMRRRKKPSEPGQPPSTHSRDAVASLRNILYALDRNSPLGRVVVGPVLLNQKQYIGGVLTSGTVPQLHEFGGRAGIREKLVGREWRPRGKFKPRPGQPQRVRQATFPARPFMFPALEAVSPKFPELFTGRA